MTDWLAGRWIRQYQLLEPLGGSQTVYRARQRDLGIDRAFRVVPESYRMAPEDRVHAVREAQAATQLRHPGIVPVHEVFEEDGLLCIVMDLVDAWTLADRVRRDGPLPPAEAGRVALQVGETLDHAHAGGVVHGHLKPQSVLLRQPDQTPLLTGFGVAGARVETPPGPREDVRALAAVFSEMVAGQALPRAVDEVLARGRAAQTSARELAAGFAAALTGLPIAAVTEVLLGSDVVAAASASRRTGRPAVIAGAVAAAALLVAAPAAVLAARGAFALPEPRPAGATDAYVENIVVADLDRCLDRSARDSPPPWTCPLLRLSSPALQLRGDATAGATVGYDGHGDFTMNGHFVVVAQDAARAQVAGVDAGAFRAQAHWNGDAVIVSRIDRVASGPPVPRRNVSDAGVLQMAHTFLGQCAAQVPGINDIAQGCPFHLLGNETFADCPVAAWKQDSDPTAGATVSYDRASGVFRVTGEYSLDELRTQPAACRTSVHRQGAYQLFIAWERNADGASVPEFLGFVWQ